MVGGGTRAKRFAGDIHGQQPGGGQRGGVDAASGSRIAVGGGQKLLVGDAAGAVPFGAPVQRTSDEKEGNRWGK